MIIECRRCHSKFNLDEGLLNEEGSKVRCSECKDVFVAYPPGLPFQNEEKETPPVTGEELEETVSLDSRPLAEALKAEPIAGELVTDDGDDIKGDLEGEVGEAISLDELPELEEEIQATSRAVEDHEPLSPDVLPNLREEGTLDMGEALESAPVGTLAKGAPPAVPEERFIPPVERPMEAAIKKKKGRRVGIWGVILGVLALILCVGVAAYFFAPDLIPGLRHFIEPANKAEVTDLGVRRLSFKGVSGSFIQTEKGIQRFVIQGTVINDYPSPRSFILLKGAILDDKGQTVKTAMVYAGTTYSEKQLMEISLEEINKGLKDRSGRESANVLIKPEGSVSFMVVFEDLPQNISEFTVEAVSSSPGQ